MSKYTTGEMAKQCGVTVRTVQYYDNQNILNPSELTEGGRRLYSEEDVQKMQLICTLRSLGLSLETIKKIFLEENAQDVISVFLQEQMAKLTAEITERQKQSGRINALLQGIRSLPSFSVQNIRDIAVSMENRKKLRKTYAWMITVGILMDLVEIGTLILWIMTGMWIPFAVGMIFVVATGSLLVRMYYRNAAFICPDCHETFKPSVRQFIFSAHTMKTRKLTCTHCGHHGFCIETFDDRR